MKDLLLCGEWGEIAELKISCFTNSLLLLDLQNVAAQTKMSSISICRWICTIFGGGSGRETRGLLESIDSSCLLHFSCHWQYKGPRIYAGWCFHLLLLFPIWELFLSVLYRIHVSQYAVYYLYLWSKVTFQTFEVEAHCWAGCQLCFSTQPLASKRWCRCTLCSTWWPAAVYEI